MLDRLGFSTASKSSVTINGNGRDDCRKNKRKEILSASFRIPSTNQHPLQYEVVYVLLGHVGLIAKTRVLNKRSSQLRNKRKLGTVMHIYNILCVIAVLSVLHD